jgi:hypothetical protein
MQGTSNTILIGDRTGEKLISGEYNCFLGDGAGQDLQECSYTFILKIGLGTLRKVITCEQWKVLREIIRDATIEETTGHTYKML